MKFLKVTVGKKAVTDLYIEVPDDFHPSQILNPKWMRQIRRIAKATTIDSDWDDRRWQDDLEVTDVSEVMATDVGHYNSGHLRLENSTRSTTSLDEHPETKQVQIVFEPNLRPNNEKND